MAIPGYRRMTPRLHVALALITAALASLLSGAETASRTRVLNPLDAPALPGVAGWMVDGIAVGPAVDVVPRLGARAIVITGVASGAGGKLDAPAFDGELSGCRRLTVWVDAGEKANVAEVGFQVLDATGEWLLQTIPLTGAGWLSVEIDPTAGGMRPAYEQKEHDGVVDLPLKNVHVVAFARAAGAMALTIDALTADVAVDARDVMTVTTIGEDVVDPGQPLARRFLIENPGADERTVAVAWSVQANPLFVAAPLPHPVHGDDHALGAPCTVVVDGVAKGDPMLTDGDASTGFATPWGDGGLEIVATFDLGRSREVTAMRWQPGDANFVFKADIATSTDGATFTPVAAAQGVDLHDRWGEAQDFPWGAPVAARHVRLRFHRDGQRPDCTRLPGSIMIHDGIANDAVAVPTVGERIDAGVARVAVPARGIAELVLAGTAPIGPGGYLLGIERTTGKQRDISWSSLFVRPSDAVEPDRARRFGQNGNAENPAHAESMRQCGFGWMRFENAKWQMFMPDRDHVAFDGSVAPWRLRLDDIFTTYQRLGLRVLPYIFQPPGWASSAAEGTKNRDGYPPKDNADYGEAVFQFVARYGRATVDAAALKSADRKSGLGLIDAVELWNEPNLSDPHWGPFVGTMAQYLDVMRAGAEGARRADPSLPITSGGFAGIGLDVVGQLAEHRYADGAKPLDFIDVVNVHFYSGQQEPETCSWDPNVARNGPAGGGTTYPEQLEDLVAWRDQLKPKAEIWITETGNDVGGPMGRSEWHQAAKLPRVVMLALAAGIDRVFVYRETGSTPAQHAGAGILRNDGSTRPSWLTMATLIRRLQGFSTRALRLPSDDPDVWTLLWEEGERRVVATWTLGAERAFGLDIGAATSCDAFGRETAPARSADVRIGYFPTYFTITRPSPSLTAAIAAARAQAAARAAQRRELSAAPMLLLDFGTREHVGMFNGHGLPRRFTPVGKDALWDETLGYGFSGPAAGDQDQGWIPDPLQRDAVKLAPDTSLRLRLAAGRHRLRVSGSGMGPDPIELAITVGDQVQTAPVSQADPITEFVVEGGAAAIELRFKDWALISWLTAVPAPP